MKRVAGYKEHQHRCISLAQMAIVSSSSALTASQLRLNVRASGHMPISATRC